MEFSKEAEEMWIHFVTIASLGWWVCIICIVDKNGAFIEVGEMVVAYVGRDGGRKTRTGKEARRGCVILGVMKCKSLHQNCSLIAILPSNKRIH